MGGLHGALRFRNLRHQPQHLDDSGGARCCGGSEVDTAEAKPVNSCC